MKDNKICKGNYIPYDEELDKKEYVEKFNATFDYVRRFGIELDNKGNRIFNPMHIIMNDTQVLINRSFFKGDLPLLKALMKLPKDIMEDVLRAAFRTVGIYFGNIDDDFWDSKDYILINDFDPVDVNSKQYKIRRKHQG